MCLLAEPRAHAPTRAHPVQYGLHDAIKASDRATLLQRLLPLLLRQRAPAHRTHERRSARACCGTQRTHTHLDMHCCSPARDSCCGAGTRTACACATLSRLRRPARRQLLLPASAARAQPCACLLRELLSSVHGCALMRGSSRAGRTPLPRLPIGATTRRVLLAWRVPLLFRGSAAVGQC